MRGRRGGSRIAAIALAVSVGAGQAGCGGSADDDIEPVAYTVDLRSGTVDEEAAGDAIPAALGALPPGEYRTFTFRPAARFEVPEGWALALDEFKAVDLLFGDPEDPGFVSLRLIDPETATVPVQPVYDLTGAQEPSDPFPADYLSWIRAIPEVSVGAERDVEVGGRQGLAVDIDLADLPAGSCGDEAFKCLDLGFSGTAFTRDDEPFVLRVRVIDFDDRFVLVASGAELYAEESEALIASIRWLDE